MESRRVNVVACTVIIATLLSQMIYIFLDKSVWPFDPAWYGEVSLSLSVALKGSLHNWIHEMVHAFGTKAPLIAWIGQFLVFLFILSLVKHGLNQGFLLSLQY